MASTDLRSDRVTVRIVGPRRNYPTLIVFLDGQVVFDQQTFRADAKAEAQHLIDHAEDIAHAAYPSASVIRLYNEVRR